MLGIVSQAKTRLGRYIFAVAIVAGPQFLMPLRCMRRYNFSDNYSSVGEAVAEARPSLAPLGRNNGMPRSIWHSKSISHFQAWKLQLAREHTSHVPGVEPLERRGGRHRHNQQINVLFRHKRLYDLCWPAAHINGLPGAVGRAALASSIGG
jgi:hypothetical protein